MKPVEIENERVITFFVKKIPGQQKIGKTPLCVITLLDSLRAHFVAEISPGSCLGLVLYWAYPIHDFSITA